MGAQVDQVLQFHLHFYRLIGMHSLLLPGSKDGQEVFKSRIMRIWSGFLLVSFTALALMCVFNADKFLYEGDAFGRFNDGLKFAFAELAVVSIYSEAIWRRYPLSRFWQLYAALAPVPMKTLRLQLWQHWRFLIKIYGTLVLETLMISVLLNEQDIHHQILHFWSTFQPFVFLIHLRNTQYVLHVELLRQQLQQLLNELTLLVEYSEFANRAASFAGYEEFMRRRVLQKQIIYGRIHELSTCFIQAFSYSIGAVFLMIYIRIAIDCYFMYYSIHTKIDLKDYYLVFPALLEVPAFIYISQSCMQMVFHIAFKLHNILVRTPALSRQIQNFSLQLLHQPVHLHCLGIVILDSSLLTRSATAIGTYMLFTVQLMPKIIGSPFNVESSSI